MILLGILAVVALGGCVAPVVPSFEGITDESPFRVGMVIVGDTGTGEAEQYEVARGIEAYCKEHRCDFGLLLGDNIYPKGIKSPDDQQMWEKFELPYDKLDFKFHPVIGNHDDQGSWKAQVDYKSSHWDMPSRWYTLAAEDDLWEAFGIDTSYSAFQNPRYPQQRDWLKVSLAESEARWKIVFAHYPIFSYGFHGDDSDLKRLLKPQLEAYDVDFYLSGHDHNRQAFTRDGVYYVVSGAGAKSWPLMAKCGCDFADKALGFAHLLLSDEQAVLRFMDSSGRVQFEKVFTKN